MEITNYKGIIVVDNFITPQENNLVAKLIEKPKCYETDTYWRYLGSDTKVAPYSVYIQNVKYFKSAIPNCYEPTLDNTIIDIKKRICSLLGSKFRADSYLIQKVSTEMDYGCDNEVPMQDFFLGTPSIEADNHNNFNNYAGEWGLTEVGTRQYCARIFINDDFKGGNITFPLHEVDIGPLINRLILYPCNKNYIQGIRKVEGSCFYLTYWFVKF